MPCAARTTAPSPARSPTSSARRALRGGERAAPARSRARASWRAPFATAHRARATQLHTHAVVCNLTRGPEGRHSALDGRALYRQAKTAGYLYQAELRARLSGALKVEWGPVERGVAEIEGVPRHLCEHFSTRRAEIVERVAESGGSSRRARQVAAYETRRAKDYGVPLPRLREEWRARAAEHGLDREATERVVRRRPGRSEPSRAELRRLAAELAGPGGLTREQAAFDRRSVLQGWAESHRGGAPVARLEQLADAFIGSADCVELAARAPPASSGWRRATRRPTCSPASGDWWSWRSCAGASAPGPCPPGRARRRSRRGRQSPASRQSSCAA